MFSSSNHCGHFLPSRAWILYVVSVKNHIRQLQPLSFRSTYTVSLSAGVSGGVILSGLITLHLTWRWIYYIAAILIGSLTILVIFTLPETSFNRSPVTEATELSAPSKLYADGMEHHHSDHGVIDKSGVRTEHVEASGSGQSSSSLPSAEARVEKKKESFSKSIRLFHGTFTHESLWKMFYRPIVLLAIPSILWATLVSLLTSLCGTSLIISRSCRSQSAFLSPFHQTLPLHSIPYMVSNLGNLACASYPA